MPLLNQQPRLAVTELTHDRKLDIEICRKTLRRSSLESRTLSGNVEKPPATAVYFGRTFYSR
jgi:hypothetical protein